MEQKKETLDLTGVFDLEDKMGKRDRRFTQELLELYDEDRHSFLDKLIMIIHRCNSEYEAYEKNISK